MSGIEVAGLVLGIFPLITGGLKLYINEKNTASDLFKYQRLVVRMSRDLSRNQTIFRNSCRRFMEDIAIQCGVDENEVV